MESVLWVLLWVVGHKNVDVAGDKPNPRDVKLCDEIANMAMTLATHVKRAALFDILHLTLEGAATWNHSETYWWKDSIW